MTAPEGLRAAAEDVDSIWHYDDDGGVHWREDELPERLATPRTALAATRPAAGAPLDVWAGKDEHATWTWPELRQQTHDYLHGDDFELEDHCDEAPCHWMRLWEQEQRARFGQPFSRLSASPVEEGE